MDYAFALFLEDYEYNDSFLDFLKEHFYEDLPNMCESIHTCEKSIGTEEMYEDKSIGTEQKIYENKSSQTEKQFLWGYFS